MGHGDIPRQRHMSRAQAAEQCFGIGQPARGEVFCQQMRQFRLTGLIVSDEQQMDHSAAGLPSRQVPLKRLPRFGVFGAGEQAVAIDRTPQGLRFAPQRVDDVVVVDDMNTMAVAATARSWMADDQSAAEKGLDAVIVEMDPQTLSDQL